MSSLSLIQRAAAKWLAVFALVTVCAVSNVRAADLTVTVAGLRSPQGEVLVAIYDSAATFPKRGSQIGVQMTPVRTSNATVVFRNLHAGRYALTAFHDVNSNGKLDFNMLGIPVEAVGFSRDALGNAAAPAFDKAAVDLDGDVAITINLR